MAISSEWILSLASGELQLSRAVVSDWQTADGLNCGHVSMLSYVVENTRDMSLYAFSVVTWRRVAQAAVSCADNSVPGALLTADTIGDTDKPLGTKNSILV